MKRYCLNGYRLKTICIALLLITACGCADQSGKPNYFLESARIDMLGLPDDVIEGSRLSFLRKDSMTALLLAGGASVAMHNSSADDDVREHSRNRAFDGFWSETLNVTGGPGFHFAATGLWYAICAENQDDFNKQRAWTMIRALSVTGFTTLSLKAIRNNDSPNGEHWAWPSGHTSSSFTVASVLDEFYGPKVGIPAYVFASLVAYRMVDEGEHWASDIVFGGVLGWIVGHTIAGKHKELEIAGFKVMPYTLTTKDESVIGANFIKRF